MGEASTTSGLKLLGATIAGFLTGILSIVCVGIFEGQEWAVRVGAVLNVYNEVVSVTHPRFPWVQLLALGAFGTILIVALLLILDRYGRTVGRALYLGFLLPVVAGAIYWAVDPEVGQVGAEREFPIISGVPGWVELAIESPALHIPVLTMGAILLLGLRPNSHRRTRS